MQKSLKNVKKYFQRQFWKVRHEQNIIKIASNERGDQTHLLGVILLMFWACRSFQIDAENIFLHFLAIFALFKLQRELFLVFLF